jgi:hypothetical protein
MITLAEQIDQLNDTQAVRVLALTLDGIGRPADPFTAAATETHLREALAQPDIVQTIAPDDAATPATLARAALHHLAEAHLDTVTRALTIPTSATRFDPLTLTIGALVVKAFHAEIELTRDPTKGWSFHFHTKPLKDSTIGNILSQLLGALPGTKP